MSVYSVLCQYSWFRSADVCIICFMSVPLVQICGNGVVEDGEQCDCGYAGQCDDTCCVPQTDAGDPAACTLVGGAACRSVSHLIDTRNTKTFINAKYLYDLHLDGYKENNNKGNLVNWWKDH